MENLSISAAQIPRNGSRHAGSKQPHQNRGGNHQQGQPQHLAAGLHQVVHLYRIADAKGLIFQPHQQHCLGRKPAQLTFAGLTHGCGQLGLYGIPAETGHLGHGRKLGGNGIQRGSQIEHNIRGGKYLRQRIPVRIGPQQADRIGGCELFL